MGGFMSKKSDEQSSYMPSTAGPAVETRDTRVQKCKTNCDANTQGGGKRRKSKRSSSPKRKSRRRRRT